MNQNATTTEPNALQLLKADHDQVMKLFEAFEKMKSNGKSQEKQALVDQICMELTVHARVEEEIFYPTVRRAIDDLEVMEEAEVEHEGAKNLIAKIKSMDAGDDSFEAHVKVLSEYIRHHAKEEEDEMFPKVLKSDIDLKTLGEDMKVRKEELLNSWDDSFFAENGSDSRKKASPAKKQSGASRAPSGGSGVKRTSTAGRGSEKR